jgi:hypothetical protein
MASIQQVRLTITPVPNSANVSVDVGYVVSASNHDLATEQNYREICQLIGDDTPGDGTDDILRAIFDATTVFTGNSPHFTRAIQLFLRRSVLDEDNEGPFIQADEIRAKVTMTPIPTSRESNLIRPGGVGPVEGNNPAQAATG